MMMMIRILMAQVQSQMIMIMKKNKRKRIIYRATQRNMKMVTKRFSNRKMRSKDYSCKVVRENLREEKRYRRIFKEKIFLHTQKSTKKIKTTINEKKNFSPKKIFNLKPKFFDC